MHGWQALLAGKHAARCASAPHLVSRARACEALLLALNHVHRAGTHVWQPALKLLRPHQPQARGHNHEQRPLSLHHATCTMPGNQHPRGIATQCMGCCRGFSQSRVRSESTNIISAGWCQLRTTPLAAPKSAESCCHLPHSKMPEQWPARSCPRPSACTRTHTRAHQPQAAVNEAASHLLTIASQPCAYRPRGACRTRSLCTLLETA